jgi:hypothetical protein
VRLWKEIQEMLRSQLTDTAVLTGTSPEGYGEIQLRPLLRSRRTP